MKKSAKSPATCPAGDRMTGKTHAIVSRVSRGVRAACKHAIARVRAHVTARALSAVSFHPTRPPGLSPSVRPSVSHRLYFSISFSLPYTTPLRPSLAAAPPRS